MEAVNWAAGLLRPDATGLLGALQSPNPHYHQVVLEKGLRVMHVEGMSALFTTICDLYRHILAAQRMLLLLHKLYRHLCMY